MHLAHSGADGGAGQPLSRHLIDVGTLAAAFAEKFGGARAARAAGLLHDLGKYTVAFQGVLAGSGKRVDHSTAGARAIVELAAKGAPVDRAMAALIAFAVAGHHAGLGDVAELVERLKKDGDPLDPVWTSEIVVEAMNLLPPGFALPKGGTPEDKLVAGFRLAFLGRMLFSCLVDADYRDTETFYAAVALADRIWPLLPEIIDELVGRFDAHMGKLVAARRARPGGPGPVDGLRADILAHVRGKAVLPPGVFTLTVPTGGGKTLASLAFALDHARAHGLRRIVYAIPFTSVIEQSAAVFCDVLGDDVVLEHHSAIDEEKIKGWAGRDKLRLAMEDWAAPVVVTTNVQLFESLFANRPSRCRKLHNLAQAVIILDEAQTIPLHVLRPCVAALDELARNYGATIVLCTATQPALTAPGFTGGFEIGPERELAPDPPALHRALGRVTVRFAGKMSDDDLVAALAKTPQGLVIVNSRGHALALYRAVKAAGLDGAIHLSTRQTAHDRREILGEVRRRLSEGEACRVISTSLVEAGVDVDFPRVWRAVAGLDQITQAAGRCNREGRRPVIDSLVTVFEPAEAKPPGEIAGFIGDMGRMFDMHADDLTSPAALTAYFREVYWRKGDRLDAIPGKNADGVDIRFPALGAFDFKQYDAAAFLPAFGYRSVGDGFRLIESGMAPVIIARDATAQATLDALAYGRLPAGAAARPLQPFVVQVPPRARQALLDNGHVRFVEKFGDQFAVLMTGSLYATEEGLIWEDADYLGEGDIFV